MAEAGKFGGQGLLGARGAQYWCGECSLCVKNQSSSLCCRGFLHRFILFMILVLAEQRLV